jgi:centromere protein S
MLLTRRNDALETMLKQELEGMKAAEGRGEGQAVGGAAQGKKRGRPAGKGKGKEKA